MLTNLHLLRPLWLLAFIPLLLILWQLVQHQAQKNPWHAVVDPHLLPHLLVGNPSSTAVLPFWLLGLGTTLLILTLAGPVWQQLPQPVYQTQKYLVIALSLAPTMGATDLKPSRLGRARFKILDLLQRTKEGQTALLAYAAYPLLVAPLTSDTATIAEQVPMLNNAILPPETQNANRPDLALAYADALLQRTGSSSGTVLLVTDALDYPVAAQEQAKLLYSHGYRVVVLGVGTAQGAPVALNNGDFLKDANGNIVLPRLHHEELQLLAAIGGGRYAVISTDDRDLDMLFPPEFAEQTATARPNEFQADQWYEEGPWLLLALLPLAAMAFRRGWLILLLLSLYLNPIDTVQALEWQDWWLNADQQGARDLAAGRPQAAAEHFLRPEWRAAAQYQAGDYHGALQSLKDMTGGDAAYNRGNILAKLGRFKEAIAAYEQALASNPQDDAARANRELLQRLLERQQPQDPQSSQNQQDSEQNPQPPNSGYNGQPLKAPDQTGKSSGQATTQAEDKSDDQHKNQSDRAKAKAPTQKQPKRESATKTQQTSGTSSPSAIQNAPTHYGNQPRSSGTTESTEKNFTHNDAGKRQPVTVENQTEREQQQQLDLMLNMLPDDPAGLLRERLKLQYMRRNNL